MVAGLCGARRLPPHGGLAALCLCTMLAGCGLSREETADLLPPATIAAEVRKAEADAAKSPAAASNACDPVASPEDLLRRARANGEAAGAQLPPCPPAQSPAAGIETGSLGASPARGAAMPNGSPAAGQPSSDAELFIDFEPDSVTLPERNQRAIREAVAARMLGGARRLRIVAARGGSGNMFDQAVIAQKRARAVKDMLPVRMVSSVEFDPTIPEDTVKIEFKGETATSRVP